MDGEVGVRGGIEILGAVGVSGSGVQTSLVGSREQEKVARTKQPLVEK